MTNKNIIELPWQCPEHPDAKILHSWDTQHIVWGDGYPRGGYSSNHKFECNECGTELRPPQRRSSKKN